MKKLSVKEISLKKPVLLSEARHLIDLQTVYNSIDVINWKEFSYRPNVRFLIGHTKNEIWLKYDVQEKHILARETEINGDVYKDSCVEFFISLDGENYYNFEFNCIGTIHLAYGPGRGNRKLINPELIKNIKIESTLGNQPFEEKTGDFNWEMMIRIPLSCFAFDKINSLEGVEANANFYKCGDETTQPHFVTWNPIGTKNPDYHCPEYFGKLFFE